MRSAGVAGHEFACHFPVGSPEGKEAWDRNLAAGMPQTLAAAGELTATEDLVTEGAGG